MKRTPEEPFAARSGNLWVKQATAASAKKNSRRKYRSDGNETCRSCSQSIPAGSLFVIGLTEEPHHQVCKRLGITPIVRTTRPATSPFKDVQFTPRPCAGCSDLMHPGERTVHVDALPWHHECLVRERAM